MTTKITLKNEYHLSLNPLYDYHKNLKIVTASHDKNFYTTNNNNNTIIITITTSTMFTDTFITTLFWLWLSQQ